METSPISRKKWNSDNQTDKFTMVQSFKIDLMKGLTLTANANWYYSEGYYENFYSGL